VNSSSSTLVPRPDSSNRLLRQCWVCLQVLRGLVAHTQQAHNDQIKSRHMIELPGIQSTTYRDFQALTRMGEAGIGLAIESEVASDTSASDRFGLMTSSTA